MRNFVQQCDIEKQNKIGVEEGGVHQLNGPRFCYEVEGMQKDTKDTLLLKKKKKKKQNIHNFTRYVLLCKFYGAIIIFIFFSLLIADNMHLALI